jgi:hypothetical protein
MVDFVRQKPRRKTVVRIEGEGDKATEEVLAAIGWTIEEKENE